MKRQAFIENYCKREGYLDKFIYNILHHSFRKQCWWNNRYLSLLEMYNNAFHWEETSEGYMFWADHAFFFNTKYRASSNNSL